MQTKDSEIARLSDIVAGLAQQMASLAVNQANNSSVQANAPAPPAAGVAVAATSATPAASAPTESIAAPAASTSAPVPDSQQTLINQEIQDEQGTGAHRRWYVVAVGLQVGVFRGWTNVAPLVLGVTGTIFNREPTREAAIIAFNNAAASGQVRIIG
ncbi:hypothetical protein EYR40_002187 [Pleurotus pulmonarius]|nr:hypothetical protein EYR36_002321 [Pleurotus pulmonarius]KAF4583696.1 hypothetical protein EYR40_002187 [Pleurotus pulmonarius]